MPGCAAAPELLARRPRGDRRGCGSWPRARTVRGRDGRRAPARPGCARAQLARHRRGEQPARAAPPARAACGSVRPSTIARSRPGRRLLRWTRSRGPTVVPTRRGLARWATSASRQDGALGAHPGPGPARPGTAASVEHGVRPGPWLRRPRTPRPSRSVESASRASRRRNGPRKTARADGSCSAVGRRSRCGLDVSPASSAGRQTWRPSGRRAVVAGESCEPPQQAIVGSKTRSAGRTPSEDAGPGGTPGLFRSLAVS